MKNILILGGTGAIGVPLVNMLAERGDSVWVTSRRKKSSSCTPANGSINFIQGNAKDMVFLRNVLSQRHWDALVDFMIWGSDFPNVVNLMLDSTDQYVFTSSARVYAQTEELITEETPRLLDVCTDEKYLKTNEYALEKAREENLLKQTGKNNFTIIRPTITYNNYRLQLGVLEKENWLYRALHGRSIVFSNDIVGKLTTMTFGDDVALGYASVIGKKEACGEAYHVTSPESLHWTDVLDVYLDVLEQHTGNRPKVVMTDKSNNLQFPNRVYQVIYCRYFNRTFDNSKIAHFVDPESFISPQEGLANCLNSFLSKPKFGNIDWSLEALNDRAAGEHTPLDEIKSLSDKMIYIAYRYNLRFLLQPIKAASKVCRMTRSQIRKMTRY